MTERICSNLSCPCHAASSAVTNARILGLTEGATDSIVFPLIAGIGSRCVLAADAGNHPDDGRGETWKALIAHARITMALSDAKSDWNGDQETYLSLATFACASLPELLRMVPERLALRLLGLSSWRPETEVIKAFSSWYDSTSTPLPLAALVASRAAHHLPNTGIALPLGGKSARTLRVRLAERVRSAVGATPRWPEVLRYTLEQWNGTALESLTLSLSAMLVDSVAITHFDGQAVRELVSQLDHTPVAANSNPPDVDSLIREASDAIDKAKQSIAIAESEALRRVADVQAEADRRVGASRHEADEKVRAMATRLSRAEDREKQLEAELQRERLHAAKLEAQNHSLRQERDEYAEQLEGERAAQSDAPPPPDSTFSGYRILVFTGTEDGSARDAMKEAFIKLGTHDVNTTCHRGNRANAADAITRDDALVVIDTSFLSHAASDRIRERARAVGAWCYLGSHGSSSIARAAAGAFLAHKKRMSEQQQF
jgi:hypothetical protein